MRTQQQFLNEYGKSHRNPVNQMVHFICVPVIVFSTLGLLWLIPIGRWLGLEGAAATWVNGATLLGVLAGIFYLKMSFTTFLAMTAWFGLSIAGIYAIAQLGAWPLFWISAGLWVAAWAVQVWGHKVEGAKPSFADDLVFLLIGPIFVMHELREKLR
jgi:uncharacterized membrane protein YGL010W